MPAYFKDQSTEGITYWIPRGECLSFNLTNPSQSIAKLALIKCLPLNTASLVYERSVQLDRALTSEEWATLSKALVEESFDMGEPTRVEPGDKGHFIRLNDERPELGGVTVRHTSAEIDCYRPYEVPRLTALISQLASRTP